MHLRAGALALVVAGGVPGAAAREAIDQALPAAQRGFPAATFSINLAGAFLLGLFLEALVRSGPDLGRRRSARLIGGTGFCGAFTTYSTMAVESVQLARHGALPMAIFYVGVSVAGGVVAAAAGIALGATHARGTTSRLPIDPDV